MISKNAVEGVKERLGYSCAIGVSSVGKAGGLCLFWQEEIVDFTLVSLSQHHICGDMKFGDESWRFVGVYGWPGASEKQMTWDLVRTMCNSSPLPLLFGGDFNEILSWEEKEGGAMGLRRDIEFFREALNDCELRDLGFEGQWWTWERGKTVETRVRERLDRFLATSNWCNMYPNARVEHLLRHSLDHVPIIVRMKYKKKRKRGRTKSFKFETAWLIDESCEVEVKAAWTGGVGLNVEDKLQRVGASLMRWSKEKFKEVDERIEKAESALKQCQQSGITRERCDLQAHLEEDTTR